MSSVKRESSRAEEVRKLVKLGKSDIKPSPHHQALPIDIEPASIERLFSRVIRDAGRTALCPEESVSAGSP